MQEKENYDIFISYETTTGKSYAEHLKKALKKGDYKVFVASEIVAGGKWISDIDSALRNCKYFIVIITSLTVKSEYVLKEYNKATELNKRIIPCRYSKISISKTRSFSEEQQLDFENEWELANKVIIELDKIKEKENKQIPIEKDADEYLKRGILFYNISNFRKVENMKKHSGYLKKLETNQEKENAIQI
ncbi:MAG: hypothetical protein BWK75_00165 [Candidatus Altiarchaeales archaeon A3]|nr:MAG: hypothetical protein BWK75_00165 [Candidatus Altiarchaeales archaeon A3]